MVERGMGSKIINAVSVDVSLPLDPQWRPISDETKGIVERLLLEKISLFSIARALQISELWLQQYVNQKSKTMPQEVQVRDMRPNVA